MSLSADDKGEDIAEYAVMIALILIMMIGVMRMIGHHASDVFSSVGSSLQKRFRELSIGSLREEVHLRNAASRPNCNFWGISPRQSMF